MRNLVKPNNETMLDMALKPCFEKLDLQVDIERLIFEYKQLRKKFAPQQHTNEIKSVSLMSSDGKYTSGLTDYFINHNGPLEDAVTAWRGPNAIPKKSVQEDRIPTEACVGAFRELLMDLDEMGFWPRRAKINFMKGPAEIPWHVDCPPYQYALRFHIPLITNPTSFLLTEGGKNFLPADGGTYLLNVARKHSYSNQISEERVHLIVAVWDTKKISKTFGYEFDWSKMKSKFSIEW